MQKQQKKTRLGRGLAALIGDDVAEEAAVDTARTYRQLPIEFIEANPRNPRKSFGSEEIQDLANSVREKGVLQPIVVRPCKNKQGRYEIVAGERRWRAAQQASLHEVPVIIKELSDGEALEIAIIENVQRADLNPLEEAEGYKDLIARFDYTQEQLSKVIGKSRSHIANTIRLTKLPDAVLDHLRSGALSAGHARALLTSEVPADELAKLIIAQGLSVRDAERLATDTKKPTPPKPKTTTQKDADTIALEKSLADALGLKVDIVHKGTRGGELKIQYMSLEQLDDVCRRLTNLS